MTSEERSRSDEKSVLAEDTVYEEMNPLEPYTTRELSNRLDAPIGVVWSLLNQLVREERVRKKVPEPGLRIWVRVPPTNECLSCGHQFQVKVLDPVLSSVRYCPQCGIQIE